MEVAPPSPPCPCPQATLLQAMTTTAVQAMLQATLLQAAVAEHKPEKSSVGAKDCEPEDSGENVVSTTKGHANWGQGE